MLAICLEDRRIRLAAGELILYPSSSLHRVDPVTRGRRLAIVGWVRSLVREPAMRKVLFDLELALRDVFDRDGKSPLFDRLVKARTNLLRMWPTTDPDVFTGRGHEKPVIRLAGMPYHA